MNRKKKWYDYLWIASLTDLHRTWIPYHGSLQAALLVRVLPYGHHDTTDMQSQKCDCITETIIQKCYTVIRQKKGRE